MSIFYLYVYMCTVFMQCPWKPESDVRYPEIGVTEYCETPYRCWELSSGLLEEQLVLLMAEPSLHHQTVI